MPGPNSIPNGDTTVMRGHVNEKFVCRIHGEKELDACEQRIADEEGNCKIIPLRWYLSERGRLRTGKTK